MATVLHAPAPVPPGQQAVWTLHKDGDTALGLIRDVAGMGREFRVTVNGRLYWCAVYRYGSHLELMAAQHRLDFEQRGWCATS